MKICAYSRSTKQAARCSTSKRLPISWVPPIVRLLNPADYLGVMTSGVPIKEKKHYLAEYKKYVAETIVYDHEYHIVFSIMRDITSEEERQSERSELCNEDGGHHQ